MSEGPLTPRAARARLPWLGRLLCDADTLPLWERDTRTLPRGLQALRRRYRSFAETAIAPRSSEADLDPRKADVRALFLSAAREGFQTEFLPRPLGSARLADLGYRMLFPSVLKAEEFAAACSGLGLSLLGHDLGIGPLFISGDLRAIFRWMRRIYREIRSGEPAIAAFAITEPEAGSDVQETLGAASARVVTRARQVEGGFRISGRKVFITNGAVARWITLFACVGDGGLETWTCFLVDTSMHGLSVGRSERKMGQRAADATELVLDDVFVPRDRIVGRLHGGFGLSRSVLTFSRPGVGAISVGIARNALEHATAFCKRTKLNGRLLVSYQAIQLELAQMMIDVAAARALVWQTVRQKIPFQATSAMAKVFGSDTAWSVATRAMALLADHGYLHAHGVEKAARDARLTQIYEGTNEINRLAIVESQMDAELRPAGEDGVRP